MTDEVTKLDEYPMVTTWKASRKAADEFNATIVRSLDAIAQDTDPEDYAMQKAIYDVYVAALREALVNLERVLPRALLSQRRMLRSVLIKTLAAIDG